MPLFETLLTPMLVAIAFLQLSRKLKVPYPTMLAIAGMIVAALPWAPDIGTRDVTGMSVPARAKVAKVRINVQRLEFWKDDHVLLDVTGRNTR